MSETKRDSESASRKEQPVLFPGETITESEEAPAAVWVVASRKMDDPHPHVEGVYDNEAAAREHMKELRSNSFQHSVVAFDMFEQPVRGEADV